MEIFLGSYAPWLDKAQIYDISEYNVASSFPLGYLDKNSKILTK